MFTKKKQPPIKSLITAPEKTTLQQAEDILHEYRIEKLPVVDKNGKLIGLITYKDITKVKNYPFSSKDDAGRLRVAAAVGVTADRVWYVTVCKRRTGQVTIGSNSGSKLISTTVGWV